MQYIKQENNELFEAIHSPTFDVIHSRVIAESSQKLIQSFTRLINTGMEESNYQVIDPEFWKLAKTDGLPFCLVYHRLILRDINQQWNGIT